jgi:hypothetical protein
MRDLVPLALMRQPKFLSAPSHSVSVPQAGNSAVLMANAVSVLGTASVKNARKTAVAAC